jgi:hypothetical protein
MAVIHTIHPSILPAERHCTAINVTPMPRRCRAKGRVQPQRKACYVFVFRLARARGTSKRSRGSSFLGPQYARARVIISSLRDSLSHHISQPLTVMRQSVTLDVSEICRCGHRRKRAWTMRVDSPASVLLRRLHNPSRPPRRSLGEKKFESKKRKKEESKANPNSSRFRITYRHHCALHRPVGALQWSLVHLATQDRVDR